MWAILDQQYEDERTTVVNYFWRVNPLKLADVDIIIAKYSSEGFNVMWSKFEATYGPVTCADRRPGTTATADEQETQRARLRDYYCSREELKSEEDIDDAVTTYAHSSSGGYDAMWALARLDKKDAEERPNAAARCCSAWSTSTPSGALAFPRTGRRVG